MSSDKADYFDCVEVYGTDGELEGYTLWRRRRPCLNGATREERTRVNMSDTPANPIRCCRTCAWADLKEAK